MSIKNQLLLCKIFITHLTKYTNPLTVVFYQGVSIVNVLNSYHFKMFLKMNVLKISQYSQENICVAVCFNKVAL